MADGATSLEGIPEQPEAGSTTDLPLVAYAVNEQRMALVPAPAKRKWMDGTDASFANRCLPLLIAASPTSFPGHCSRA